jgi:hypothetical protein
MIEESIFFNNRAFENTFFTHDIWLRINWLLPVWLQAVFELLSIDTVRSRDSPVLELNSIITILT